ncbi:MAG: 3-dehydroquinate synthase, partial [Candidatus Rokuibacteriota bacterium]
WGQQLSESLDKAKIAHAKIEIPDGERYKTLSSLERLAEQLSELHADRNSVILAFGGGVIGDVAGMLASVYMRGIAVVQIPTTLLAQVDASVGGKTGVNLKAGKNLMGTFHQPLAVIIDPEILRTLPEREFRSGLAEIVKHGAVLDRPYFEEVERDAPRLLARELDVLDRIIGGSCRLKAGVIERDPEEKSELRFALNYGHTIGHALEAATGYERWTHGEAVALGIVAEARLACRLGVASEAVARRQERLLAAVGLPTRAGRLDAEAVLDAMTHDKKARDGRVPFVLAPDLGQFRVVYDVAPDAIRLTLGELVGEDA